jgi:cytidyltransferase-like protein
MSRKIGVIHGRFQPLHIGHLEYLLAGKARCDLLVVGLSDPDPWQRKSEATNPERGQAGSNPCTFYERYLMVEGALRDEGVAPEDLRIVPFPISWPERLSHYAPRDAEYYLSIYDDWGDSKLKRLQELGLNTTVLWRRDHKVTTGTRVRNLIASGGDWQRWVPAATARVIVEQGIDRRIVDKEDVAAEAALSR